jgi:hypothetical protein
MRKVGYRHRLRQPARRRGAFWHPGGRGIACGPGGTLIRYYLPAPCQTGRTWVGRRVALERMGWGIAVLFIAHERNATELHARAAAEFAARGRTDAPRLWIVRPAGLALDLAPAASGVPSASIWQGRLDTAETWSGTALTVDANVALPDVPGLRGR